MKSAFFCVCLLLTLLLISSPMPAHILAEAAENNKAFQAISDEDGVRVVFGDAELYFNASNGGEITEYFDLTMDPSRLRNLVNISMGRPFYNLFPLFTSCFYNPYKGIVMSTGGDYDASVVTIAVTAEYVILQSSSRIMSHSGYVAKDSADNPVHINTTWVMHSNGSFLVERTFQSQASVSVLEGWRWYPFYLTRAMGFNQSGTFFLFNTTWMNTYSIDEETYVNKYSHYPIIPADKSEVFGVAVPFSNTSLGGDGGHSILVAYRYRELMDAEEWRSDNYYSGKHQTTESGPVHEFQAPSNVFTHTYHMQVGFTHQPVHNETVKDFAVSFTNYTRVWSLLACAVTTDKSAYLPGERLVIQTNGTPYYNIPNVTGRLLITNTNGEFAYTKHYGPTNLTGGQAFSKMLYNEIVRPWPGNYTISFQIHSSAGVLIALDSTTVEVV